MKVSINPPASQIKDDNGVGRVIHAQYRYLSEIGIELTGPHENPDIIAAHINSDGLPRVDVLHCHGLYWTGDDGGQYNNWHHDANARIIETARQALAITVPSSWVAEPFKRDMRISPFVIGHGIDLDEWEPIAKPLDFVLWNKNRNTDVCDPTPAYELAKRGVTVVSTFLPRTIREDKVPASMRVTGTMDHARMKELVLNSGIYLATTQETFGIGTVEALAAGVPVLGWDWGGTADIVEHKVSGWLCEPGDIDGLVAGLDWIRSNYKQAREAARGRARKYDWLEIARAYASVYEYALQKRQASRGDTAVIITCYNYGQYVADAIRSAASQDVLPSEIIVVDDGSTDNSTEVIGQELALIGPYIKTRFIRQQNQGVAAARNNGIEASSAEYIICLDADDMIAPQYIQALSTALNKDHGLGVAYAGLTIVNADGSPWGPTGWPPEFSWETQARPTEPPANCVPCAAMFRREMWQRAGGYKQVYAPAEDTEFFTRGLSVGYRARRVTDEYLFLYRSHGGGAHVTKKYSTIDTWHPWMNDQRYPIGAPARKVPLVYSYSKPVVSIIIPVGPNHTTYLSAAIDSVLGQTYREWELVIVNDSGEPLDLPAYPFARIVESDKRHPGGARNLGIQTARAPLVFFLDADDFIHPSTLFQMVEAFAKSDGFYVYSDWLAYDGSGAERRYSKEYNQADWLETIPHSVTALIPREWALGVGGFDEKLPGWEEWDFYLKMAVAGYCGIRVPEPLLGYRVTSGIVRKRSQELGDTLKELITARYRGIEMAGCCGGNGKAVMAAKSFWTQSRSAIEEGEVVGQEVKKTRMRFIGQQVGVQVWRSKKNKERRYYGANDNVNRFADVHPEDVEQLLSLGLWEIVQQPAQRPAAPQQQAIMPVVPTVSTPAAPAAPPPPPRNVVEEIRASMAQPQPQAPAPVASAPTPQTLESPIKMEELDGSRLPPGVQQLPHDKPEPPKKRVGRPKQRGYIEDEKEF